MKIIDIKDKDSLQNAADVLKRGGILVFPTDTVYGIGCLLNEKAIRKLYKIKNRPSSQPTAILMTQDIFYKNLKHEKEKIENVLSDYPSGRVTMVFYNNSFSLKFPSFVIKERKVGIRLPKSDWLEELINLSGPIVASSANKRGKSVPTNFSEIDKRILKDIDLAIKDGKTSSGIPSTVYDIEENKLIRA